MKKRKNEVVVELSKRQKKYIQLVNESFIVLYSCPLHDDDKDICCVYDCNGKNVIKHINNTKEYIK